MWKYCPFQNNPNKDDICIETHCALYDEEYERCCVLSLVKTLEETANPNKAATIKIREA